MKKGQHDENCINKHPECLCNHCVNDHGLGDIRGLCCVKHSRTCNVTKCEDFQEDETGQTNGEMIRAMSDEELASFMFKMGWTLNNYNSKGRCASCKWDSCEPCLEDWLKEGAKP